MTYTELYDSMIVKADLEFLVRGMTGASVQVVKKGLSNLEWDVSDKCLTF